MQNHEQNRKLYKSTNHVALKNSSFMHIKATSALRIQRTHHDIKSHGVLKRLHGHLTLQAACTVGQAVSFNNTQQSEAVLSYVAFHL